ncbi:MAG: hypothetical protein ACYC5G_06055 [Candidatus Doudnabacteria bacterium]
MSELSELSMCFTQEDLKIVTVAFSQNKKEEDDEDPNSSLDCEPVCNPRCSPNCNPCYPAGKCDPKLFG